MKYLYKKIRLTVHKCKLAIYMYKVPQSHLPVFMALIIPNMRINMCYFVERCAHCPFLRQHFLYIYCCWEHEHLLTIKTVHVTSAKPRHISSSVLHNSCARLTTPTATGLSQVATTLLAWEVTMSEKMAANSTRPAAGGIDCKAVQFPSHWRSRYACTAEREHDRVNRLSISLSAERKDRTVTSEAVQQMLEVS